MRLNTGKDAKPHPALPSMFLTGQDFLWTGVVDFAVPESISGIGVAAGQPELGVIGKWLMDLACSAASLQYDAGRVEGDIPTVINAGISYRWGEWHGYVLVYPQDK